MLVEEPVHVDESGVTTNSDDPIYTDPPEEMTGYTLEITSRCHNLGGAPESSNGTTDNFGDLKHGTIKD